MVLPVWLHNLISYNLQIAVLASVGTLLIYLFRVRMPRTTHLYWQAMLAVCLLAPYALVSAVARFQRAFASHLINFHYFLELR